MSRPRLSHMLQCVLTACAFMVGCQPVAIRPNVVPMRSLSDSLSSSPAAKLIVMLPGVYNLPEHFIEQGFVAALRERNIDADVLMLDAHYGYYESRTIADRLHHDVIVPARAKGYREIWLVGISLGAYGALVYASEHALELTGIFLIAPYPGPQDVIKEIRAAGGPLAWAETDAARGEDERRFWRWLVDHQQRRGDPPVIFLGSGESDRFFNAQKMMAEILPPERRRFVAGGHDWPAWKELWRNMLDAGPLR